MTRFARLACAVMIAALTGCETTGDPREGGLFGWSESKARERQARKEAEVAGAETDLTREQLRGETLQARDTATSQRLAAVRTQRVRDEGQLRAQQAALVAKAGQLEADSPTAATASRARALRMRVNTVAAQSSLTPRQRADRLEALEAEIDAARARLAR